MRTLFAAEKMRNVVAASRQRMSVMLLELIERNEDVVLSWVAPGGKTIDWLCVNEERVWNEQISRGKTVAAMWTALVALGAPLVALLYSFACPVRQTDCTTTAWVAFLILCSILIVSFFACARSILRLSILKHRGHASSSEHMFEHIGGNFWIAGRQGLYLAKTIAKDGRFFVSAVRYDYEKLSPPKLTVGTDVSTISLYENERRYISCIVFSAGDRLEANRAFAVLESRIKSVRPLGFAPSIA